MKIVVQVNRWIVPRTSVSNWVRISLFFFSLLGRCWRGEMSFVVINKISEERGCIDDLMKLLNLANRSSRPRTSSSSSSSSSGSEENERGLTSVSSDDQCQKLGSYSNGMLLCKCTTHLCNSASEQTFSLLLLLLLCFISFLPRRTFD